MANPVLSPERWQEAAPGPGPEAEEDRPGWAAPPAGIAGTFGTRAGREVEAAPTVSGPRMTVGGTATALGVLFVLVLSTAAIGWAQVTQTVIPADDALGTPEQVLTDFPGWVFVPMVAALVLGLITVFKPRIARFTAPLYALGFGFALGAISHMYDAQYDGIVLQAIGSTIAVFTVMLFLYASRIIKVTQRFVLVVVAATGGIFLLYLATWIATAFGADIMFWRQPTPLGIALSVGIVIIAALNLAIDFAFIEQATSAGVPKYYEWYGAFGLMVTLIWLYLELLRLLSLLRQN
jgi:uncharacterized YccA/Bax inhibitor family protein